MAGNAQQQSRLKELIARGKEQGYLTYAEVNDHLPEDIADPDQVEDIIGMINDMGISVAEEAPDEDTLMMSDQSTDESAAEEAVAALAAVESDVGRTTDPVRMYMREMGTVELLTREGEIEIAKRIEEGTREVMSSLAYCRERSRLFWTPMTPPRMKKRRGVFRICFLVSSIPMRAFPALPKQRCPSQSLSPKLTTTLRATATMKTRTLRPAKAPGSRRGPCAFRADSRAERLGRSGVCQAWSWQSRA